MAKYTWIETPCLHGHLEVKSDSLDLVRDNLKKQQLPWREYEIIYFDYCFDIPARRGRGKLTA